MALVSTKSENLWLFCELCHSAKQTTKKSIFGNLMQMMHRTMNKDIYSVPEIIDVELKINVI